MSAVFAVVHVPLVVGGTKLAPLLPEIPATIIAVSAVLSGCVALTLTARMTISPVSAIAAASGVSRGPPE